MRVIYHLTDDAVLEGAHAKGFLEPPSLASEGFVHASYLHQIVPVANLLFTGHSGLRILELDRSALGVPIVDEPPDPPGPGIDATDLFPHIHGPVPVHAIRAVHPLAVRDGSFELPAPLRTIAAQDEKTLHELVQAYPWYDHPEGPKFAETHRDEYRTSGHWLFPRGAVSSFHQVLDSEELWLIHLGRLRIHVIHLDGRYQRFDLGVGVAGGERPVVSVPPGAWQAAELAPGEPFAFGTNVCAPGFTFESSFVLAKRESLATEFPNHRGVIERLAQA